MGAERVSRATAEDRGQLIRYINMIKKQKQELRERIWSLMEEQGIARFPSPIKGRIPNFEGAESAAEKLKELPEWQKAKIIESNPDYAQRKARELVLKDGKTLIMASPRLKAGFLKIVPEKVKRKEYAASTIKGAFAFGERLDELPQVDLKITGSVAVDRKGRRLGKGGGFGDREVGKLKEKYGKMLVITTVHDLQVIDEVPVEKHDQGVDIILTPTKIIRIGSFT